MVKGASGGGRRSTKKDLHKRYLNYIGWRCGQLSLRQFSLDRREIPSLPVETAFVPLRLARGMPRFDRWGEGEPTAELTLSQWLADLSRAVVLGFPGSGKSTLLRWLALSAAQGSLPDVSEALAGKVPLLVRLGRWASQRQGQGIGYSIPRFLAEELGGAGWDVPESYFVDIQEKGEALFLLDGLDEVLDLGLRNEVADLIDALSEAYPGCSCVVASRVAGYEDSMLDPSRFPPFTILEFSREEVSSFLARWPKPPAGDGDAHLWGETWMEDPSLGTLTRSPLGLGVLAANFRPDHLPNERAKLWDRYSSLLLARWDESKGLAQGRWGESAKRRRLEDLAHWLHSIGRNREDATAISCSALRTKLLQQMELQASSDLEDEARAFMDHVRTRSGFLLERGADICSFVSYGAQEYFTACAVLRWYRTEGGVPFLQGVLRDVTEADLWRDVVLLALAELPWRTGSRQLLSLVKADSGPEGDPLRRAGLFASHCLVSGLRVEDEVVDEVLSELLSLGETSRLEAQKEQFARALATLAGTADLEERVMRRLASAIRHESGVPGHEVALIGLRSLAAGGDERALALLRDLADETEDPVVQSSAAEALVASGQTHEAVLILSDLLAPDRKVPREHRKRAIVALGQIEDQDETVLNALRSAADTSRDDTLRVAAARAIGDLGQKPEAVEILLDVAETSSNGVLRRSALDAVVKLEHVDDDVVERLFHLSKDGVTEAVRSAASRALGDLGQCQPAVCDRILEIFQAGASPGVRLAAAQALVRAGDREKGSAALLEVMRSSENPRIQRDAVDALVEFDIKEDAVVSELAELAGNSKNDDLRRAAGEALGSMGEVELASQILLELARGSGASWVRRDAVKALAKVRGQDQELLSDLQPLARNASDGRVRLAAAEAMAALGDPEGAALWLMGLARSSRQGEWIRRDALKALGELEVEDENILDGVATLVRAGTPDNLRRYAAEVMIGWSRKEEAIQTLLEIAEGARDDRLRREAIYSLEEVGGGSSEIIDALLRIAADERSRWVAESALEVSHRLVFGGEVQG